MARWLFLFGGLLIWAAHFGGVYLIASIADVAAEADVLWSRIAVGAYTVLCAAGAGVLAWMAFTGRGPGLGDEEDRSLADLWRTVGGVGALLGLVAVLWQGLPALIGH